MLNLKTTNGHSLISPSGATRWANCPASVRLTMNGVERTNKSAQRGTDIHQLGEDLLNGKKHSEGTSVIREYDGGMFYAGRDMLEEATAYRDYVKDLIVGSHAELFVESKVEIFPEFELSGHVDACVIDQKVLHVIDLKTGRGAVSADNNMQLMMYAIGLYDEHEMFYEIDAIKLHIVQDNAMIHNTNSWECSVDDLMDFKEWIYERAEMALQEDSVCVPSEKACQWCGYADKCVALNEMTTNIISGEFDTIEETIDQVDQVSMDAVLTFLNNQKLIMTLLKAYEGRIEEEIRSGNDVEGWKVIQKRKNKSWVNEAEAHAKLKSWFTKDEFDEFLNVKLITPTQALKLTKGELTDRKVKIFDELWEQKEGDLALAPSSSKAPAVIFGDQFDEEE